MVCVCVLYTCQGEVQRSAGASFLNLGYMECIRVQRFLLIFVIGYKVGGRKFPDLNSGRPSEL